MCHVDHHQQFLIKIILTCDLASDLARGSKDTQRIELKPITQLSSTGKISTKSKKESLERTKFDGDTLNPEKHDDVTNLVNSTLHTSHFLAESQ